MKNLTFKITKLGDINDILRRTAQQAQGGRSVAHFSFEFVPRTRESLLFFTEAARQEISRKHQTFNLLLRTSFPTLTNSSPAFSTWSASGITTAGFISGTGETIFSKSETENLIKGLLRSAGFDTNGGRFTLNYRTQTQVNAGMTTVLNPPKNVDQQIANVNQTVTDNLPDISLNDAGKIFGMALPAVVVLGALGIVLLIKI